MVHIEISRSNIYGNRPYSRGASVCHFGYYIIHLPATRLLYFVIFLLSCMHLHTYAYMSKVDIMGLQMRVYEIITM